jgi:hypothetical protein
MARFPRWEVSALVFIYDNWPRTGLFMLLLSVIILAARGKS